MLDDDGIKDKKEREHLFKEYETEKELEDDLKDPYKFEKWVTYPGEDPFQKEFNLDRKAQRKYEIFCGGFLHYHDIIFKKYPEGAGYEYPKTAGPGIAPTWKEYPDKDFEHEIYFEWFPKGGGPNNKTSVIIHINPTPPLYNGKPPPPPAPPPPEST
ncbi:MAG: hypothetical protein V4717_09310 [Bacteroidota bacterium]